MNYDDHRWADLCGGYRLPYDSDSLPDAKEMCRGLTQWKPAMSDTILSLIPQDPSHMPDASAQESAVSLLRSLAPQADRVEAQVFDNVTFIDQGENFESVHCPGCKIEVEIASWQEWMSKASESEFRDLSLTMPCCGGSTSLNDLIYEWPAGFARFALVIQNPNIDGWLGAEKLAEVGDVVGCKLRQIYAHI
jgi:hypothetical protein